MNMNKLFALLRSIHGGIFWVYLLNLFTVINVSRKMYFEVGLIVVQNI